MERSYSSPLRQQQEEMTRNRIMEALLALISEGRIADFTVRDVAKRAGVSYGSVYRHYPTKEALLEALHAWVEQGLSRVPVQVGSIEELPDWTRTLYAMLEEHGPEAMAVRRTLTVLNFRPEGTRRRNAHMQQLVAESFPGLEEPKVRQTAAVLRHLSNSGAWLAMRDEFGLSAEETADALAWATEVLIRSLKERNG